MWIYVNDPQGSPKKSFVFNDTCNIVYSCDSCDSCDSCESYESGDSCDSHIILKYFKISLYTCRYNIIRIHDYMILYKLSQLSQISQI